MNTAESLRPCRQSAMIKQGLLLGALFGLWVLQLSRFDRRLSPRCVSLQYPEVDSCEVVQCHFVVWHICGKALCRPA